MYPAWILAQLRASINDELMDTCTIIRYGDAVNDDYGLAVRSIVSETSSACALTRASRATNQDMITHADKGRAFYMLSMPYDTDIQDGDTIIVASEDYETKQVIRSHSNDVMRQALLVKAGS